MEFGLKEDLADAREEASTESDEEGKSDKKKPRMPRRKFQWNSEIGELLLEIVSAKMTLFAICKSRNQTAEEYLKAFLDSDIKAMWPQGWMQTRTLFKESRKAHEKWTKAVPQQGKPRKMSVVDTVSSIAERIPPRVSKTEDVIEISSVLESDEEKQKDSVVIIDISSSNGSLTPSPQKCLANKQSFKTTMASSTPMSSSTITQTAPDNIPISAVKRNTLTPVTESLQSPVSRSSAAIKSFSPGLSPIAALSSGSRDSNTQQIQSSINQRSTLQKSTLQQKNLPLQQTGNNIQQHKLSQELQKVSNLQQNKAATSSSSSLVVNKDTPNSPLTNVNSFVPAVNKFINPVVAVNRIPDFPNQKLLLSSKGSQNLLPQNQMHLTHGQQQEKIPNNTIFKPNQTQKKPPNLCGAISANSNNLVSESALVNKSSAASMNVLTSSKPEAKTVTQPLGDKNKTSSFINRQSGFVSVGSPSSLQNVSSLSSQTGPGKQSSPLENSAPPNARSSSPALIESSLSVSLLNISPTPSSRGSTPSPEKSPVSPEINQNLSLYEQIKSQISKQEAMEDQALKNLALAMKFGGSDVSDIFGGR